jgi:hypothetical protein
MDVDVLAGYLLEELLASLIQSAGYRLLTDCAQDPDELRTGRNGDLLVRGRGGNHQADVLGEFMFVPAFSQPVRLFVEAKARNRATGLPAVRNAVGTIIDVNEAWMVDYFTNRTRRHYRYALFSTSGFSSPAQDYALAHQISLVDLSGPEWTELIEVIRTSAAGFLDRGELDLNPFPVRQLRQILRERLGTLPQEGLGVPHELYNSMPSDLYHLADLLAERFRESIGGALLVFPASAQVQLARPDNLRDFLVRANVDPAHRVTLSVARQQSGARGRTWVISPLSKVGGEYTLRLTLPEAIEARVLEESDRYRQVLRAKDELGGRLDIFWDPQGRDAELLRGPRLFRLMFAGIEIRERRPAE